jgi:hypothetical protein
LLSEPRRRLRLRVWLGRRKLYQSSASRRCLFGAEHSGNERISLLIPGTPSRHQRNQPSNYRVRYFHRRTRRSVDSTERPNCSRRLPTHQRRLTTDHLISDAIHGLLAQAGRLMRLLRCRQLARACRAPSQKSCGQKSVCGRNHFGKPARLCSLCSEAPKRGTRAQLKIELGGTTSQARKCSKLHRQRHLHLGTVASGIRKTHMPTVTHCRKRARELIALAEREPQHRTQHLNDAAAWLLLARRLEEISTLADTKSESAPPTRQKTYRYG